VTGVAPIAELVSLRGRVAVVTGAAQGFGRAIAKRFAEAGADVAVADLDGAAAQDVAHRLTGEHGVRAAGVMADARDAAQVEALADLALSELGSLDVWVNNAGVFPRSAGVVMTDDEWDFVLDLNLRGSFLGCRAAGRRMVEQGRGGVILNLASVAGHRGYGPGLAHYVSSKHGVLGLTKSFAVELGPHGIRVLALSPTSFPTEGVAAARAAVGAQADPREGADAHPLNAARDPDHVARVALFCASDLAAMCTGSTIPVDAGVLAAGLVDRRYEDDDT
jgi:NAD(P)-dependent dehydrogenase (short-subunit alcohol dehydrogenase family)